jgi:hypothetical protein
LIYYKATISICYAPSRTEIVARIEEEQKLVDANKKLIELFEGKINGKIAEVWDKWYEKEFTEYFSSKHNTCLSFWLK